MNWQNVKLIFLREVRDQLRDRRTLFMIFVLPLLMYPLLGLSILQVSQFLREQPTKVLIVNLPQLSDLPPLVVDNHFDPQWLSDPAQQRLFELLIPKDDQIEASSDNTATEDLARQAIQKGEYQAAVVFPADFAQQLEKFRAELRGHTDHSSTDGQAEPAVPNPVIYCNTANEKSHLAYTRLSNVLRAWADAVAKQNLKDSQLPEEAARPFEFQRQDVSEEQQRTAALWSKILPFVLLLWALTGAFYPAVDLCAGEKERGTLETLLCSPAQRSEIVTGKLFTVMVFSMMTSVLNLLSMGLTGGLVISHLPAAEEATRMVLPPLVSQLWLLLALVPVSALFSALCIALAAFARSTREGQYYLMPLVLVTLPLVILPMGPGMELNLGNSLIPLTGLVLLLRALLEGNYLAALPYVPIVVGVTLLCCLMAVRWAIEQFNKESVLFRESERLDVSLWLRHLLRDRKNTPTVAEAVFCAVLILLIRFFMSFAMQPPDSFSEFVPQMIVTELVVVALPALLMTVMLTRSPGKTLLLRMPASWTLPAAVALAVVLHPALKVLQVIIMQLYPVPQSIEKAMESLHMASNFWPSIAILALLPAVCEELAFRGFILSGFRHLGHKWWAIVLSSILFGIVHTVLQQSIVAGLLGMVIGYLAIQTSSILPGMLFHFTNNALSLVVAKYHSSHLFQGMTRPIDDGSDFLYPWWLVIVGILIAATILIRFARLDYRKTKEEKLQEAIERQAITVNV
ncbi:MAG TPA: ABC transporter permease subunit/CPBP intramembrane protease [Pirellulales bacterium]|jgi:sodium transport system permease protein|nr:ABC transporter permease subunit/CPBP intramembrane protease [Pirellulales bacterium]